MKLFNNFMKALICGGFLALLPFLSNKNTPLLIANFSILFITFLVFSSIYDIINEKLLEIKKRKDGEKH